MTQLKNVKHGIICNRAHERFGYFGWPTIGRMEDGTLVVGVSGLRFLHICPWGRSLIFKSQDNGETWSDFQVINNTPLDDRDVGIIPLSDNRLAMTWFTSVATKKVLGYWYENRATPEEIAEVKRITDTWDDALIKENLGSWIRVSPDGEYWGEAMPAPVNAPHGFIVLKDGSWLYLGNPWTIPHVRNFDGLEREILAVRSTDEGKTWEELGKVPFPKEMLQEGAVCESHVLELPNGTLLGAIRHETKPFHIWFSESTDQGRTWSEARDGFVGAPPHLMLHSSGKIICSYGVRNQPFGEYIAVSSDMGKTWESGLQLRSACSSDLGYPATVELPGGELLTVYYQQLNPKEKAALCYTRWTLD